MKSESLIIIFLATIVRTAKHGTLRFPPGFKIGVSSSAYQIEGAWNVGDKGISVWDEFTHQSPSPILGGSNGDISSDSYHKYKEDVAILKNLGVDFYRFSLSWTRILPTGFANKVSKDGIQYYKNLLDELNAHGIESIVTIYHWDHPFVLEEMGGWTNEMMVTWYTDYARVVFRELGDRIKIFTTVNEPSINCVYGYALGISAPGKKNPKHAPYLCMHNMLKAHAKAYKIYDSEFRNAQGGKIGIAIHCPFYYPKYHGDTESPKIKHAFDCGWKADPIFSEKGDYPAIMKRRIAEISKLEGYAKSRLPEFTQAEIDEIRGSSDYFGLNHYTSFLTEPDPMSNETLWLEDSGVVTSHNDSWPRTTNSWLRLVPQGFGDTLRQLKKLYNNPQIYVLENGCVDDGSSRRDLQRIQYLHDYLRELLIAVNRDGCNVSRYATWSLMDNFEWYNGYSQHYGLVSVDFQHPSRPRKPKMSYKWFKKLIRSRKLPWAKPVIFDAPKCSTTMLLPFDILSFGLCLLQIYLLF